MSLRHLSDKEYAKIRALRGALEQHVPAYQNYFVIPIRQCDPAPLSPADLEGIDATCGGGGERAPLKAFQRDINDNLSNYRIINMADGGVSFSGVNKLRDPMWSIPHVFDAMCNLLEHGIVPLNNADILHFDIKNDNMVYNGDLVRLIDWDRMQFVSEIGLDTHSTLPRTMTLLGQPVAYALHSTSFKAQLNQQATLNNEDFAMEVLARVVRTHEWHEDRLAHACDVTVDKDFLKAQIIAVLNKFRSRGARSDAWEWDWAGYRELLRHNFDVYGWLSVLLTCYVDAPTMFNPADVRALKSANSDRVEQLKRLFKLYLYTPDSLAEPYDIATILRDVRAVAADVAARAGAAGAFTIEASPSPSPSPPSPPRLRPRRALATPLQRRRLKQQPLPSPHPKKARTLPPSPYKK